MKMIRANLLCSFAYFAKRFCYLIMNKSFNFLFFLALSFVIHSNLMVFAAANVEAQKAANAVAPSAFSALSDSEIEEIVHALQNPVSRPRALALFRTMAQTNNNEINHSSNKSDNHSSNLSTIDHKEEINNQNDDKDKDREKIGKRIKEKESLITIVDRANIHTPLAVLNSDKVIEYADNAHHEMKMQGIQMHETQMHETQMHEIQTQVNKNKRNEPSTNLSHETQSSAAVPSSISSINPLLAKNVSKDAAHAAPIVTSNGLTAQFLRQIAKWSATAKLQIRRISNAASNIPRLLQRIHEGLATPLQRNIAFNNLGLLVLIGFLAWLGELIVFYFLRLARQHLNEKAQQVARQQLIESELNAGNIQLNENQSDSLKNEFLDSDDTDNLNLHKDDDKSLPNEHKLFTDKKDRAAQIDELDFAANHLNIKQSDLQPANYKKNETAYRKLQRLRLASLNLAYSLIPLIVFFVIAIGLITFILSDSENDLAVYAAAQIGISAYISLRIVLAITQFLIAPKMSALRLVDIDNPTAHFLYHWMITLILVIVIAGAGNELAILINFPIDFRIAWLKLAGLIVHILLLVIVFQSRHRVKNFLTTSKGISIGTSEGASKGISVTIKNGLAKIWTWGISSIIITIWIVWAFGVEDGFQRLIHFVASTALLIIAARVFTLLIFAVLARLFENYEHKNNSSPASLFNHSFTSSSAESVQSNVHPTANPTAGQHYHKLLKNGVSLIIGTILVLALFENWGFSAIDWLTHKRVGQHFASALVTIAMTALLAIIIWESVHLLIEKRLRNWQLNGDRVRSARLRTLLPMLRTLLFITIALLFGLTALNELGVNTTPLLAGASLVGVAIGLGSQKLIQDFATGIFLLMENSMQVGDWVTVAGVSGTVEHLSIRTVRLRALDGSVFTVPFSSVTTVNNVHRGIANAAFRLSIAFCEDVERVSQLWHNITREMRQDPAYANSILSDLDWWGVDQIDGSGVIVLAQLQTIDADRWRVQREFNRRMLVQIRKLGIVINNPQQRFIQDPSKQLNSI